MQQHDQGVDWTQIIWSGLLEKRRRCPLGHAADSIRAHARRLITSTLRTLFWFCLWVFCQVSSWNALTAYRFTNSSQPIQSRRSAGVTGEMPAGVGFKDRNHWSNAVYWWRQQSYNLYGEFVPCQLLLNKHFDVENWYEVSISNLRLSACFVGNGALAGLRSK